LADALGVLQERYPPIVDHAVRILEGLERGGGSLATPECLQQVFRASREFESAGFRDRPSWRALAHGTDSRIWKHQTPLLEGKMPAGGSSMLLGMPSKTITRNCSGYFAALPHEALCQDEQGSDCAWARILAFASRLFLRRQLCGSRTVSSFVLCVAGLVSESTG